MGQALGPARFEALERFMDLIKDNTPPKLYMVPLAPNPTKIMLYLKGESWQGILPVEQIVVNTVKGRHKEPEHLARNPFGTVPTLELDDGAFIKESLAILEYFEDAYPEGNFQSGYGGGAGSRP